MTGIQIFLNFGTIISLPRMQQVAMKGGHVPPKPKDHTPTPTSDSTSAKKSTRERVRRSHTLKPPGTIRANNPVH